MEILHLLSVLLGLYARCPFVSSSRYRMQPASVSTNTSCSSPRSRAEGVSIVFGPIKIFSLRVIARRTSFSLTNGEIGTAGAAEVQILT